MYGRNKWASVQLVAKTENKCPKRKQKQVLERTIIRHQLLNMARKEKLRLIPANPVALNTKDNVQADGKSFYGSCMF
jgi:hypothetical protein